MKQEFSETTLELLLINYTNINNSLRVPCAEKQKFEKLIEETTLALSKCPLVITYKDGMTVLEYATHLAAEAIGRNNPTK